MLNSISFVDNQNSIVVKDGEDEDIYSIYFAIIENSTQDKHRIRDSMFPNFYQIMNPHNLGFTAGANQALRLFWEMDVMLVNSDIIFQRDGWLEALIRKMNEDSRNGIIGFRDNLPSEKPDETGFVREMMFNCVLLRREMLNDIGLLDERLFLHCSDSDLCDRARRRDWRPVVIDAHPGYYIRHVGRQATITLPEEGRNFIEQDKKTYGRILAEREGRIKEDQNEH